ncbi:MAG: ABC transporter ATP-binding protein [Alphaproteobacteria bacterium]
MASVVLDGLTKAYGGPPVVDHVDLAIGHGQLVCLLGPSGCGKTTTLRLVAGFVEPTAGTISVGDRVVSAPGRTLPPEQRHMSMIFQSYALWPHMTIGENVAYGLKLRRLDGETIRRRVAAILDVTKMAELAGRYPGELSGGQQQRVALARALVVEPEILLLDEPLSNLDAALREEMRFELRRLHDAYRYTTIYVTHDQAEAMTTADTIVVMKGGRIAQAGTPEEVYYRPRTEFVARFIGGTNILKGRNLGDGRVAVGGLTLRCGQGRLSAAGETAVSVRLHDVRLVPGAAAEGENAAPGRIVRQAFLGAVRDYLVELPDGTQLRAVTPGDISIAPGAEVGVTLPAEHCRALSDD